MTGSIDNNFIHLIPADLAWSFKVVPKAFDGSTLELLIDASSKTEQQAGELEIITGYLIQLVPEEPAIINDLLSRYYRKGDAKAASLAISDGDDFLDKVIQDAMDLNSSDIHFESYSAQCRIRLRIDGKLMVRCLLAKERYSSMVNKIKIKAKLDISERRLPQDGRLLISTGGRSIDLRISVMPSLHGEKVVLRLLGNDAAHIDMRSLGFTPAQLEDFSTVIKKPHGIILISGPTGSGKTTTLYAALKQLNNDHSNILTIEDPIEYTLDGINQVQLKENIGLTFASALRTFLRQDPDVIMLGEIRDGETAQMAIRAALTGHLVLSTIHTNSALGIISRLIDLGIPAFLLASTLNFAMAQRLVRKLCASCRTKTVFEHKPSILDGIYPDNSHYVPTGCSDCYFTGYSGRIAIYEGIMVTEEMRQSIKNSDGNIVGKETASFTTLKGRALELFNEGVTSFEEIYPLLLNET